MKRLSRSRRALKWVATLGGALTIAAWILGQWYVVDVSPRDGWHVRVVGGLIGFEAGPSTGGRFRPPFYAYIGAYRGGPLLVSERLGLRYPRVIGTGPYGLAVPAWICLLAMGLPATVLWWRDRRARPGYCPSCGYDLTGNVSGRCPECGVSTRPEHEYETATR
jgi:hypothetical protein